jgi:hypothetical protein
VGGGGGASGKNYDCWFNPFTVFKIPTACLTHCQKLKKRNMTMDNIHTFINPPTNAFPQSIERSSILNHKTSLNKHSLTYRSNQIKDITT